MRIAMCLEPEVNDKWFLAPQLGVTDAVIIGGHFNTANYREMATVVQTYRDHGLNPEVLEGPIPMERIKQGLEGWESETESFIASIRNMAALGIQVYCYSWMTRISWSRTSVATRTRGGALTTVYDDAVSRASPEWKKPPVVLADTLWMTLERFLDRVIPICEAEGVKLAIHPDDPPLPRIFDTERIMNTVAAFERVLAYSASKVNGLTMCQANFAAMGADVPATIRQLGRDGRVHFAHFRNIKGDATHITETFHDDGMTDMYESMRAYHDIGFKGVIRPDHTPVMWGEENSRPGYMTLGRLHAIGYMRGLMEGVAKEKGPW
jgi:mannonate dehydratase